MIKDLIKNFITEKILFSSKGFPYSDSSSFIENGIIDSMNVLEVVLFVEEQFGITVEDSEVVPANFDSVDRLAQYVEQKKQPNC
jgi:acyl carrier protein